MLRAVPIFALLLAAGCTQFPEVDKAIGDSAKDLPYPTIVPLSEIDTATAKPKLDAQFADAFAKDVDALDRRGAWLRQQDIQ